MLGPHVWVRKLAAWTSCCQKFHRAFWVGVAQSCQEFIALIYLLFIGKVAKQTKGWAWEKDTKGIWTLPLIYRLEAGVIKHFHSRYLACDLSSREKWNRLPPCDAETPSKQMLDPFGGTVKVDGVTFLRQWPNVDTKQFISIPSSWLNVDF